MKVIVFGASGFIGGPVANALVRNGHIVVGQTRNEKHAASFKADEIIPLIADPGNVASWVKQLSDADVVIDCLGAIGPDVSTSLFRSVVKEVNNVRGKDVPKLAYIYTSGSWIHGEDRVTHKSDSSPFPNPASLVAWRVAFEREVTESNAVRGIVIRPSLLYGRGASLVGMLFAQAAKGAITWHGKPGGRYATVHIDDLAELYVLTTEKNHLVSGVALIGSNDKTDSVDSILYQFAEIAGIPREKVTYRPTAHPFEEAFAATTILRPTIGRAVLGWVPKKASLYDGLATYYEAWKAQQA